MLEDRIAASVGRIARFGVLPLGIAFAVLVGGCGGGGSSGGGGGGAGPLTISTTMLADADEGQAYSATLNAGGGSNGGFTWTLLSGLLPTGVTLQTGSPNATLSGTPTAAGTFNFTVQVTDSVGGADTQQLTLVVNPSGPALSITTSGLPSGVNGSAYSQTVIASGGTNMGYSWAVSSGALPAGLTLSSGTPSATISGTPSGAGTSMFTLEVTDSAGTTATQSFTVTINATFAIATGGTLSTTTEGQSFNATLSTTGGTGLGLSWAVASGSNLPTGLTLTSGSPTATISGMPSVNGTFMFTIDATDSGGNMASQTFTLVINPPVAVTTMTLPDMGVTTSYNQTVSSSGGTPPYTWSVSAGALPTNVTLTTVSPNATLTGTPSMAGMTNFTLQVTDSVGSSATQAYTPTVHPAVDITTTMLPQGGLNVAYNQTVSSSGGSATGYTWSVSAGALPMGVNVMSGTPDATLSGTPTQSGMFNFTLQVTDSVGQMDTQAFTLDILALPPIEINETMIPPSETGSAYTTTLTAMGGTGMGFTFAVTSGSLPMGLSLAAGGTISGTPTQSGGFTFTVTATDSGMNTGSRTLFLNSRIPERYLVLTGDVVDDNETVVYAIDVSTTTPGMPIDVFPSAQASGDVSTSATALEMSPDGRYVAFFGDLTTDTAEDLYIVDLSLPVPAATRMTNIPAGRSVEEIMWSPDSRKIACNPDLNTANDQDLIIVDITAGLAMPVTHTVNVVAGGDVFPTSGSTANDDMAWSADSTKFYFRGDILQASINEACMFDLNNPMAGAQRLHPTLPTGRLVDTIAAAGPDIALYVCDLDVDNEDNVYAVSTAGGTVGTPVRLNPLLAGADAGVGSFDIRPSPCGNWVAFVGDFTLDGSDDCWVADLRNGIPAAGSAVNVSNLGATTADADTDPFFWSPQGDKLIYLADQADDAEFEAFFVDLRGGMPTPGVRISAPVTTFENVDEVRWAPNGSGVTLEGEFNSSGVFELFYVNLAGAMPGPVIQLSNPGTTTSDVEGDTYWLPDSSAVVYRHDLTRSALNELFIATPPNAMMATRIHTDFPAAPGTATVGVGGVNDTFITRDSQRVLFTGDCRVDNLTEPFMVNLPTLPNLTRLTPSIPAGGDSFTIVLYHFDYR